MILYLRESPTIVIICMWTTWWLWCRWLHLVLNLSNLILVISHIIILLRIGATEVSTAAPTVWPNAGGTRLARRRAVSRHGGSRCCCCCCRGAAGAAGGGGGGKRERNSLNLLSSFVSNVFSMPSIFSMASSNLFIASCTCPLIIC